MPEPTSIYEGKKLWRRRDPALPPTPQRKWAAQNRQKRLVHHIVQRALRLGTLRRGRCEVCGSFRVDAHHSDYDKPLAVTWLCRKHHQQLHAAERAASKEAANASGK